MAYPKVGPSFTVIMCIIVLSTILTCTAARRRQKTPTTATPEENGGKISSRDHARRNEAKVRNQKRIKNVIRGSDVTAEDSQSTLNASRRQSLSPDVFKQRMRAKHIRLFNIRQQILQGLGMTEQPNFTTPVRPDLHLLTDIGSNHWVDDVFDDKVKVIHRGGDDYLAKSVQALAPSCQNPPKSDEGWRSKDHFRLYFNVEKEVEDNDRVQFSTSSLWLYKKPLEADCNCQIESQPKNRRSKAQNKKRKHQHSLEEEGHKLKVTIYRYLRPVRKDKKERKELVSSHVVSRDHEGWIKLDMKSAVESWLDKPKKNFGILVVTEDSEDRILKPEHVFVTPNCSDENAHAKFPVTLPMVQKNVQGNRTHVTRYNSTLPALDIYTVVKSKNARLKRGLQTKKQHSLKKPHCGTEEMYIKFKDLGWKDWIIQPQGFKHVTCKGSCTRFPKNKYFRRLAKSDKSKFKPIDHLCCGPVKFKPLKVIHLDAKQDIKLSIFEDFLITECACLDGGN